MKQIQLPSGTYLLVEVDEKAKNFQVRNGTGYLIGFLTVKKLPTGQWSIIGKADELKEEDWKGILPQVRGGFAGHLAGYKDYNDQSISIDKAPLKTATESGLSLIASHNMQPFETLILKLN